MNTVSDGFFSDKHLAAVRGAVRAMIADDRILPRVALALDRVTAADLANLFRAANTVSPQEGGDFLVACAKALYVGDCSVLNLLKESSTTIPAMRAVLRAFSVADARG